MNNSEVNTSEVLLRAYPKTEAEWWYLADFYSEDLRGLVASFHPFYRQNRAMRITAPQAEAACAEVREEIAKETVDDPLQCFDQFLADKNDGLVGILNQTWFGIPESLDCWELDGFDILCNLCSESYCLEPEDELPQ